MSGLDIFLTALSVVASLCAIIFGYAAFKRSRKKDDTASGHSTGVMQSDLGYIKAGVDDLKRDSKETAANLGKLGERVTRVEESTKQAHKRIDELKRGDKE